MFCQRDRKDMKALIFSTALIFALGTAAAYAQDVTTLPARVTDFAKTESVDDNVMGNENAAITLIIWASVTCPHCGQWFTEDWPIVKTDLVDKDKLRVVFRELRTAPVELSTTGFQIAKCAPTEDYMSIIEYQMENQKRISDAAHMGQGPQIYTEIAKMAGMETREALSTCLRNPDIMSHIIDNENRARVAGIKTVPAFLINGETYKGPNDAKSLVALITDMDEKGLSALPEDFRSLDTDAGHDHE